MSGEKPLKPMPRLRTDEEAERFVAEADLTEYDLSGFKPMRFELRRKDKTVSLRLPSELLEAAKQAAAREGIPYQRFMRHAIEQATHRATKPDQPGSQRRVLAAKQSGFDANASRDAIIAAYEANLAAVRTAIPPERLLVFDVKNGWEPLCRFLAKPVPAMPFPRTNDREGFWDLARQATG